MLSKKLSVKLKKNFNLCNSQDIYYRAPKCTWGLEKMPQLINPRVCTNGYYLIIFESCR